MQQERGQGQEHSTRAGTTHVQPLLGRAHTCSTRGACSLLPVYNKQEPTIRMQMGTKGVPPLRTRRA